MLLEFSRLIFFNNFSKLFWNFGPKRARGLVQCVCEGGGGGGGRVGSGGGGGGSYQEVDGLVGQVGWKRAANFGVGGRLLGGKEASVMGRG